jgi:hypothetical protein
LQQDRANLVHGGYLRALFRGEPSAGAGPGRMGGKRGGRKERGQQQTKHGGLHPVGCAAKRIAVRPLPARHPAQPGGPRQCRDVPWFHRSHLT